jgi:tripartite-type tricarboxylate transporter receptor subunit TctC
MRTIGRRLFLFAALLCAGSAIAQAPFPSRPIKFIVTSPPGGANDILNRLIGARLQANIGQPVLIENQGGASGFVAVEALLRSPADGYTLMNGTEATLVTNPLLFPKMPYDPQRDFAPVTVTAAINHVLLVNPSLPVNSVQELIAYAHTNPGKLNYASSGNGSAFHLGMELLKRMAGVEMVHVPFKGSALSMNAVLAGDVQVMLVGTPTGLPAAKGGKLRALAIAGAKRSALAPDLPTIAETLPGYEVSGWFAAVAPAGTPAPVIAKLNAELVRAIRSPELQEKLVPHGFEPVGNTPEELAALMRNQAQKWAKVIQESGAKPD